MSKKAFKSQASSSRAVSGAFGGDGKTFGSSIGASAFGAVPSSPLSYVYEPPDLSEFSDPNVVVAFKNLQKKDRTTKAKALEELQTYVSTLGAESGGVEEVILTAWAKIYPRSSIDSSRRVRQLAHTLQGQLAISCGKRMAKHMPKVAASWVAGQYDNDKSVSRAANESLHRVFSSEEKTKNVWRLYQASILEYTWDVVAKETTNTLSDERTTSADDSSAKYSRVVGASIMMVTNLMESVSKADIEKSKTLLNEFLNEEKLWKLASDTDAFVRRALYRFLGTVLARYKNTLNPSTISATVVMSGLNTTQSGSAFDYVKVLALLSVELPDVWTTCYPGSGKKSAANRLCHFLKRGSQGGPPDFWPQIATLLSNLPRSILVRSTDTESDKKGDDDKDSPTPVLNALHEGLNNKDESRVNRFAAWNTYLTASEIALSSFSDAATRRRIVTSSILPIVAQYLRPSSENSRWTITGTQGQEVCIRACNQVILRDVGSFEEEWNALSTMLVEDLKTSLPEQAKDYVKSQDSLSGKADRWYCLQAALLKGNGQDTMRTMSKNTVSSEIKSAVSILQARHGKPYGAAAAMDTLIETLPEIALGDEACKAVIISFVNEILPNLLFSPSAKYLIRILNYLDVSCDISRSYDECMRKLAEAPESALKSIALESFISSPRLATTDSLFAMVIGNLSQAMKNDDSMSWNLVMAAISNPVAPKSLTDEVLACMTEGLSISPTGVTGLRGLEMAIKQDSGRVTEFARSPKGSSLLSKLLLLADSPDDGIAQRARYTSTTIEKSLTAQGGAGQAANSSIEIVNRGLDNAEEFSLSIEALVAQARKVLENSSPSDMPAMVQQLLPNVTQWNAALAPFILRVPEPSLAITNAFGGSLSMISPTSSDSKTQTISRDGAGYSTVLRMAQYTTLIIKETEVLDSATHEQKSTVCRYMALFLQVASDNLSVPGSMPLWDPADLDTESEIVEFVAEAQTLVGDWLHNRDSSMSGSISGVQKQLLDDSRGLVASSYYNGRAYSALTTEIAEMHGESVHSNDAELIKEFRRSNDVFVAAAFLTSASESEELFRLGNYLLTDLTGHDFRKNLAEGMRKLCLVSCIFTRAQDYVNDIPQQRLVFLVQHLVGQLETSVPSFTVAGGQIMVVLSFILPAVKDIYGHFWSAILEGIRKTGAQDLFALHASLRLLNLLRRSYMLESNDDLLDAWSEKKTAVAKHLVDLLWQLQGHPDESHQPRRIINELLKRQLVDLAQDVKVDIQELYPVIASESAALQDAAYELLHSKIPVNQEQISIDKALSNDFVAQLPEELMSLILAPPSIASIAEHDFERNIPSSLRSYILSWQLTFDHWEKASYKVQADYVTALKEGTYTQDLLAFMFDILVNGRQKLVDASRYDFQNANLGGGPTPEQETHGALIHLYYLCLRRLPSITKDWWRDKTSRQLSIAVESWTQKYISPVVIAQELSVISDWAPSQSTADQPMTVKVSPSAREITASIPIDEQTMTIAIRLPPAYPLARAEVESVHRVGVAEKKWRFWIINAQGVINFSSGGAGEGNSIIDGLMAWRKNVTAAMKGQTECAICYSVVSADRQLPSKKCSTCKNTFHSSCLFRWFKSSNSSSCPLCRNNFNYS